MPVPRQRLRSAVPREPRCHGDPACAGVTRPFPTSVQRARPQDHSHEGTQGREDPRYPLLSSSAPAKRSRRQIISPAACSALPAGPALPAPLAAALAELPPCASRRQRGSAAKQATRVALGSLLGGTLQAGQDPAASPAQHTGKREGGPEMVLHHRPKRDTSPATGAASALHRSPPTPRSSPGLLAASQESRGETSPQRCPGQGLQLFLQPKPKQQLAWKRLEMKTCHHPCCFVSVQFQARLSRSIAADSVHNRVPKAAAPPEHVVFCSRLSCNMATEQGLTQQPTREAKAETTLGAAGKGPSGSIARPVSRRDGACAAFPPGTAPARAAPPSGLRASRGERLVSTSAPRTCTGQTSGAAKLSQHQTRRDGRDAGALPASSSGRLLHAQAPRSALPGSFTC